MVKNHDKLKQYDLSSVHSVFSGAAPLGEETVGNLNKIYPDWVVVQGYGMTETATVVSGTSEDDIYTRSSGSLLPGVKAKVMDPNGNEVTQLDTPGELWVQSPSVTLGYLNNEKATDETFVWDEDGRWIRTGDEVLFTLSPGGNEHLVILDRIKELIKVKVSLELITGLTLTIFFFFFYFLFAEMLQTGTPSRTRRAGSTPPRPPSRRGLQRHPDTRRPLGRSPQGIRGQERRLQQGQVGQ